MVHSPIVHRMEKLTAERFNDKKKKMEDINTSHFLKRNTKRYGRCNDVRWNISFQLAIFSFSVYNLPNIHFPFYLFHLNPFSILNRYNNLKTKISAHIINS